MRSVVVSDEESAVPSLRRPSGRQGRRITVPTKSRRPERTWQQQQQKQHGRQRTRCFWFVTSHLATCICVFSIRLEWIGLVGQYDSMPPPSLSSLDATPSFLRDNQETRETVSSPMNVTTKSATSSIADDDSQPEVHDDKERAKEQPPAEPRGLADQDNDETQGSIPAAATQEPQQPQQQRAVLGEEEKPHYLEQLMYRHGSDDKSHDGHGYTDLYQMLFDPIRHDVRNMTQVGVGAGQSIPAWYHYLDQAHIYGYDDAETPPSTATLLAKRYQDRFHYQQLNLLGETNLGDTAGLFNETMDIIIEDTAQRHNNNPGLQQQQALLTKLFPLVKPAGYYIMENVDMAQEPSRWWQTHPEFLEPEVEQLMWANDCLLVDTHIGHRAWETWQQQQRKGGMAQTHARHNSYLLVIRKRVTPPPAVQVNLRQVAMNSNKVLLD